MLSRRGFLGLFTKATIVVAAVKIPFVSPVSQKVAAPQIPLVPPVAQKIADKCGWICITINEERRYIPSWN